MLRKFLVASAAVAAISTLLFVSQSAEAGSCAVLSEKAIGLKKSETSARALKQLNRKAKHWAKKRLQDGLAQQGGDEVLREGRAQSLHCRRQGVRLLILADPCLRRPVTQS